MKKYHAFVVCAFGACLSSVGHAAVLIRNLYPIDWTHSTVVTYYDGVNVPTYPNGSLSYMFGLKGEALTGQFAVNNDLVFENFWFTNDPASPRITNSQDGITIAAESTIHFVHGTDTATILLDDIGVSYHFEVYRDHVLQGEQDLTINALKAVTIDSGFFDEVRISSLDGNSMLSVSGLHLAPEPDVTSISVAAMTLLFFRRRRR